MRAGSLCTGYGGLDIAVSGVLGCETAWCSEVDRDASIVLEGRFPGVPNIGDLTAVDWASVEPVDVVTAGYPCQPFSMAGRRKGEDDHRHLWPHIRDALRVLRPRVVVLENVAGHLGLGFDRVAADLSGLGYRYAWGVVRASDVGAPHQRARLFVVASHAVDRDVRRLHEGRGEAVGAVVGRPLPGAPGERADAQDRPAADPAHLGLQRVGAARRGRRGPQDGGVAAPDPHRERCEGLEEPHGRPLRPGLAPPRRGDPDRRGEPAPVDWGLYAPAVARWERVLGRTAPPPVVPSDRRGARDRLNPVFVEWMMGLEDGWVTGFMRRDVDPRPRHVSRSKALRILGNGVVPQQAAYATRLLLDALEGFREAA